MVITTVEANFHNSSMSRKREWQRASKIYRDTKQFCIDGWENGDLDKSITTSSIDNELYSAVQNQAIREAKSDYDEDENVTYKESQPFATNNQNWEIDKTDNGSIIVGFPCISQWWYTPIEIHDDIANPVKQLVDGQADKSRLQIYRRGDEWFCTFEVVHEEQSENVETHIGVDIGERNILAATAPSENESMLVSGKEAQYIRRKYRSLRDSLQQAGALRARNRVGNKEERRIKDMNHKLSRQLIEFAEQFENPVIKLEDLEDIRENSNWDGVHSWHFYQLQEYITYKAEKAGIQVEKVDPCMTSQWCSQCGVTGRRNGDKFSCPDCEYTRHADLNAAKNISQLEGEPCTA